MVDRPLSAGESLLILQDNFGTNNAPYLSNNKIHLGFLTGLDSVLPLGLADRCCGVHQGGQVAHSVYLFPCTLFPLNFPKDFNSFKEKMDLVVLGSQGFFRTVHNHLTIVCLPYHNQLHNHLSVQYVLSLS